MEQFNIRAYCSNSKSATEQKQLLVLELYTEVIFLWK